VRHFDKYRAKGAAATEGLKNQVLHDFFFAIGAPPFYARQNTIPADIQRLVSSLSGFCQYVQRRDNPAVINMAHRIEGALGDTVDKYFEDSQIALKQVAGPLWDYGVPNNQVHTVIPHESLPPPVRPEPHVGPQPPIWHPQPPTVRPPTARPLSPDYQVMEAQSPVWHAQRPTERPPDHEVEAPRWSSQQSTRTVPDHEVEAPRWYSQQSTRTVRPRPPPPPPPDHHPMEAQPHAQRPTVRPPSLDHEATEARQWYRPRTVTVRPPSPDHHVMEAQPHVWHSQPTTVHVRPPSPDHQAMEAPPPVWHAQAPTVHVQPPSPDHPVTEAQPPAPRFITRTTSRRQY